MLVLSVLFRILLVLLPLSPGPARPAHRPVPTLLHPLSLSNRRAGEYAARLSSHSPERAIHWLAEQRGTQEATLGPDGKTLEIHFRDQSEVAILPAAPTRWPIEQLSFASREHDQNPSSAPAARAIVLEPFATELHLGPDAGRKEIDALTSAGFRVDNAYDAQVTVSLMAQLASYSFVYLDTHAGVLPGGDAVVVTGETNKQPYTAFFADQTVIQAFVAGDPSQQLYNAITGAFVTSHMGSFPPASMLFLNGCSALAAPVFWADLQHKGVATFMSWDAQAQSMTNEAAASFVFSDLLQGQGVAAAIADARAEGLGVSIVDGTIAHLGFRGDGDETLSNVLSGIIAPSVPTATGTPVPSPTPPTAVPTAATEPAHKQPQPKICSAGLNAVYRDCRR